MLVLSRKESERIILSCGVTITIVQTRGDKVRIGIDAPKEIGIWREELQREVERARSVVNVDTLAQNVGNPLPSLEMDPDIPLL